MQQHTALMMLSRFLLFLGGVFMGVGIASMWYHRQLAQLRRVVEEALAENEKIHEMIGWKRPR